MLGVSMGIELTEFGFRERAFGVAMTFHVYLPRFFYVYRIFWADAAVCSSFLRINRVWVLDMGFHN